MNELATAIRAARGTLRTQEELARELGCSWATVQRWESGNSTPSKAKHRRALVRMGVPAHLFQRAIDDRETRTASSSGPTVAA